MISDIRYMGHQADDYKKSMRIIILRLEQHVTIGIVVYEVKEVVTLDNRQIEKVSYDSKEEKDYFLFGIGKYEDGGLISLLDLNAVVLDKEGV